MADPNPYVIELEDFSQRFERSQARKRAEEEAAMAYYDNFAEINGPFTEGVKEEMQELWGQIEDQFTLGNSTPQGRRKIKQLYNDYKNLASDALNFSQQLGTDIALIQQSPQNYKNPEELLMTLQEAQTEPVNIFSIAEYANKVPKASDNLRYQVNILTPGAAADDLIKTFSSDSFYANGKRKDEKDIASFVEDVLLGGTYQPQDIAKMIAYSYPNRQELEMLGGESMLMRLANATEGADLKDKEEAIKKYKDQLTKELINRLDTLTEQENRFQKQLKLERERKAAAAASKPLDYNFSDFNVTDTEGNIRTLPFSMTLPKQFKASFTEGEEDVTIIRKATNKFGEEGFIGTKDVVVIDPSTGEEITKNVDTFYTSDQLKGADADMERANKGSQNAFVLQKDKYSKDIGFAKKTDPKDDLSSFNRTPSENIDTSKLTERADKIKALAEKKYRLDQKIKAEGYSSKIGGVTRITEERNNQAIDSLNMNKEEQKDFDSYYEQIPTTDEEKKVADYNEIKDKLEKEGLKTLKGNQLARFKSTDNTRDDVASVKSKYEEFVEKEISKIDGSSNFGYESKEEKIKDFIDKLKKDIRKLKSIEELDEYIDSFKSSISEENEMFENPQNLEEGGKIPEKGGRVSNDTTLGRIFNRVRKALIPS